MDDLLLAAMQAVASIVQSICQVKCIANFYYLNELFINISGGG